MRKRLAFSLRGCARLLIKASNRLRPPTEIVDLGPRANMEAARKYYVEAWRESRGY